MTSALRKLDRDITACRKCPRLVKWREQVADEKVSRFIDDEYWGKPVPGFGDPKARLLMVGLAPGAHGSNRTGRMFTGDRAGDWLYRALHKAGFASQPESFSRDDGMELHDCYITASARCVPPGNKPLPSELTNCRPFLLRELELLENVRVILGLGKIGCDTIVDALRESGITRVKSRIKFTHGAEMQLSERLTLLASFHPSQQNTFTGKLTEEMFDEIFERAHQLLKISNSK